MQFLDRYVEKTFPAADLADLGVASLGVRAQVLRVSLFERSALAALGTIVAPQLTPERATAQGLSARGFEHVIYRQVLGRILSVIYFPFWVVELARDGERWLTVVDAVAESVVQPRAPLSLREALERPATDEARTVGLRPLVCPNCGGALPVEPDDVIFFCGSCHRAWQIHGVELGDMPHEIADVRPDAASPGPAAGAIYLPFWQLDPAGAGRRAARLGARLPLPPAQGAARPGRAAHREAARVPAVDRRAPRRARLLLRRRGRRAARALRGGGPAPHAPRGEGGRGGRARVQRRAPHVASIPARVPVTPRSVHRARAPGGTPWLDDPRNPADHGAPPGAPLPSCASCASR